MDQEADTPVGYPPPHEPAVDVRRGGELLAVADKFDQHAPTCDPAVDAKAGIVVGGVKETIMSRAAVASIEELRATGLFLEPLIPDRAMVQEVRI